MIKLVCTFTFITHSHKTKHTPISYIPTTIILINIYLALFPLERLEDEAG
jgi:hypothetical protein